MKQVNDKQELLNLAEMQLNEGSSYLVLEYIVNENEINLMEVEYDTEGIVWCSTCRFEGIDWIREVLDESGVDYVFKEDYYN